jgi:hypothetical protein
MQPRKNKKKIEIRYEYVESEDSEKRLDDIFDFIFEQTIREINKEHSRAEQE